MASIEEALTKSLLATTTEESGALRRQEVLLTPNPVRRAAVMALHTLAVRQPRLVARMLRLPYTEHDWEHIGSGADSTVFKVSSAEVLKVNLRSAERTDTERERFVSQRQSEHEKLVAYLGPFAVPHSSLGVGPHPVVPSRRVVEIRQPFVEGTDPAFLHPVPELGSVAVKINDLRTRLPSLPDQLGDYIERSRSLYRNHGLLPDLCGPSNLVIETGGNLRQVDGMPINPGQPTTQAEIAGYLNIIEAAVAATA